MALFRVTPACAALVLLVCLGALVLSCDEVERHNALTFFFDGVAPLSGEQLQGGLFDPNSSELEQAGQRPAWYVHEPRKDCSNCHRKQRPGGFSTLTYLIAPVPQLCQKCHTDRPSANVCSVTIHTEAKSNTCLERRNPSSATVVTT
ncbi:MAG: cytochrome c3 family protein [Planctomycetota bacterium]|jgi:hypothetical protein